MKAFIINLERSKDRKECMQKEIDKLFTQNPKLKDSIEFEFFKAVDGKNGEHLEFQKHCPSWTSWIVGRELTNGEKACFASHYKLWQECVHLNEPIMVLEDDIAFNDNFTQAMLEKLGKYEYVKLYGVLEKKFYALEDSNIYILLKPTSGTQGYFMQPSAAYKFIKHAKIWLKPVDGYMDDMIYSHKVLNIVYRPFPIKHLNSQSTIEGRHVIGLKKKGICKRITRRMYKWYFFARRRMFINYTKRKFNLHE